uniref:Uncharacterized protein n=1 Tax=Romanomermis culicivorax TaxID=13658 RepID=A0A915KSA9_ROMCU
MWSKNSKKCLDIHSIAQKRNKPWEKLAQKPFTENSLGAMLEYFSSSPTLLRRRITEGGASVSAIEASAGDRGRSLNVGEALRIGTAAAGLRRAAVVSGGGGALLVDELMLLKYLSLLYLKSDLSPPIGLAILTGAGAATDGCVVNGAGL